MGKEPRHGSGTWAIRDGNEYLREFPSALRWMNRCLSCQQVGYKPEMPDEVGKYFSNLREYFAPLALNENELCEDCLWAVNQVQED